MKSKIEFGYALLYRNFLWIFVPIMQGYDQSELSLRCCILQKGPHLGLDALEEIISRQRHSNASCGLEESHEGDSIARLAFALSHRCFALLCQRKQRPVNQSAYTRQRQQST